MHWHRILRIAAVAGLLACSTVFTATARPTHISPHHAARQSLAATGYYVDFLARPSQYVGHSYIQTGTIDLRGTAHTVATAGFYPKSAKAYFDAPGIVMATPADLRSSPSVRYRVAVSERTFRKTTNLLHQLPATWTHYDLFGRNCNHMVARVARQIGLDAPGDFTDLPENYVRKLQAMNGGRTRASRR